MRGEEKISNKAGRLLHFIAVGFLVILSRVWYLQVVQNEEKYEESLKPKRRTVTQNVERATIRDRFNIPLAVNKIHYNAAIVYSRIKEIPHTTWRREKGKKFKEYTRLLYIQKLAAMLANELDLDPVALEDLIHAKASLFPVTPFTIKENLPEATYARLKLLEKDWPGMELTQTSKRHYPLGKVASDVLGYMGAISEREYLAVADELKTLKEYLNAREEGELTVLPKGFQTPLEVRERVKYLREKAYTINDLIGKSGIEKTYDAELRGKRGKKTYEIDTRGNNLRELPGSRPITPGRRTVLTISSELQAYAEQLLATYEYERSKKDGVTREPWIRGGAIVAMNPKNGEILALASYPTFNPNDFIPTQDPFEKKQNNHAIHQWLESNYFIGQIWDGIRPLSKEYYNPKTESYETIEVPLTWNRFLRMILATDSRLFQAMQQVSSVERAVHIQTAALSLLKLSGQDNMRALIETIYGAPDHLTSRRLVKEEEKKSIQLNLYNYMEEVALLKNFLRPIFEMIPSNDDKLLLLDLCRLGADKNSFSKDLLKLVGKTPLATLRSHTQEVNCARDVLKTETASIFHATDFAAWRDTHFKDYLKEKRREEKENKRHAKPYTDYLERLEQEQFSAFWEEHASHLLLSYLLGHAQVPDCAACSPYLKALPPYSTSSELATLLHSLPHEHALEYIGAMRPFHTLNAPLFGWHRNVQHWRGEQLEKSLAAAFYPPGGFGFGRSFAFRQATPAGSVFKLMTGYEALRQQYEAFKEQHLAISNLNPLTLVDSIQWTPKNQETRRVMGYWLDGQPIKRFYKGGLMPRGHANIGQIDLPGAFEHSSNIYFSILAGDHIAHPNDLNNAARAFGYGSRTGIDLPGEIGGHLPDDLPGNKTALYSYAIGQHSLIATPLQTAVMLSALANGGNVLKPKIVKMLATVEPHEKKSTLFYRDDFPFSEALAKVGIGFPLFSAAKMVNPCPFLQVESTEIKHSIFLPPEIKAPLFAGMQRSVHGPRGTARFSRVRVVHPNKTAVKEYGEMHPYLIGKTGTAEFFYRPTLDADTKPVIRNHIWFGGIAYPHPVAENGPFNDPELVVVVYLQHGRSGTHAAPMGGQILKKWREIQNRMTE